MLQAILLILCRVQVILAALAVTVLLTPHSALRYGDRLQIALPMLAWACEGARRDGAEFFLRYAVMFTTAHSFKQGLGAAEANTRPGGGGQGFPSAHTSTAVLGASSLVHGCLRAAPLAQAVVIGAAAFVGASRIDGAKHDIWQVLAGAILGYGSDRALRRPGPARRRAADMAQRLAFAVSALVRISARAVLRAAGMTLRTARALRAQASAAMASLSLRL